MIRTKNFTEQELKIKNSISPVSSKMLSEEELAYFNEQKSLISSLNKLNPGLIAGIKDVDSVHIISTDAYAKCVGLDNGTEVFGRTDFDMPCEGTSSCAEQYQNEDKIVFSTAKGIQTSNCHLYSTGIEMQVYTKTPIIFKNKILGLFYSADRQQFLPPEIGLLIQKFGNNSLKIISKEHIFKDKNGYSYKFASDFQLELCFYVMLGYSDKEIVKLLESSRKFPEINTNKVVQSRRQICERILNLDGLMSDLMRSKLEAIGFTKTIPSSVYKEKFHSNSINMLPTIK